MQFSSDSLIARATQLSNGVKMPRTNWTDLEGYRVALPPERLAVAFDCVVRPVIERINANIQTSKVLAVLRDTLLPRLISGKLRLADTDATIENAAA